MKAIQIKHFPATLTQRGSFKAWAGGHEVIHRPRIENLDIDIQAHLIAEEYRRLALWKSLEISGFGTLPNGDFVATLKRAS